MFKLKEKMKKKKEENETKIETGIFFLKISVKTLNKFKLPLKSPKINCVNINWLFL